MANATTHLPITLQAPPTVARTFTDSAIGAAIDLRQQSGCPTHAAQRLILSNTADTAASAVLKGPDGVAFTVVVAQDTTVPFDGAVYSIEASTTDAATFSIVACWWTDSSTVYNA